MRICLVLEGCYPYVHGGVSTWMHSYITAMKEHEFVLWVIGAKAKDRGKLTKKLCVVGASSHGKGLMMKPLAAAMDAVVFA